MDSIVIWIVTVLIFISGMATKKKKKDARESNGTQNPQERMARQAAQQMVRQQTVRQQELKQRLEQRYGSPQQRTVRQENDILSRANSNVEETIEGHEEHMRQAGIASKRHGGSAGEEHSAPVCTEGDVLMEQLGDLMVKGYEPKLSYERDFVAEGIAMLNSFDIP